MGRSSCTGWLPDRVFRDELHQTRSHEPGVKHAPVKTRGRADRAEGMGPQRKVFRVETFGVPRNGAPERARPHDEIMAELKALRTIMQPREELTHGVLEAYKNEMAEAQKLKAELDLIYGAIN